MIPTVAVTRYVTPLREGGSLPGIVEADDLGTYVCKFRGAGQGLRVLVAEVIVAELAQRIELRTPRQVALELDAAIARYEADQEVQDLLNASLGLNLGIDFLPGAFGYDGDVDTHAHEAAKVLWLDAFCANVDRTWRNPNLLLWHRDLWIIDHGASLYFHHGWTGGVTSAGKFAAQPWDLSDHVLGAYAGGLATADAEISGLLDESVFRDVLERVPDEWLEPVPGAETPALLRTAYVAFLVERLGTRQWLPGERVMGPQPLAYQYVVLRCVPRPDREEFVNVGVVLFCEGADFLDVSWNVDRDRLLAIDPRIDVEQVCAALEFVDGVCAGDARGGAAGDKPIGTRFGFVKAPKSTVLQPGPVHGGVTHDPARELERLVNRLVG